MMPQGIHHLFFIVFEVYDHLIAIIFFRI
jgi:hypothetical protein